MTHTAATVIGLDIGTTTAKALIRRLDHPGSPAGRLPGGPGSSVVQLPTPWQADLTELPARALLDLAVELIARAVRAAETAWGRVTVRAVSVGGIGESGILLDPAGRPTAPAIAWFDRRGESEVELIRRSDPGFVSRFPAVTGLPWTCQATIAKLLRPGGSRRVAPGSIWLGVPEWIVHGLGGDPVSEPSLASRTGLLDQDTGRPWDEALALAGLPASFLPETRHAGRPAGLVRHPGVPAAAAGAVLSVAGHDHPVAALGAGIGPADLFNSSGTADVVARAVPGLLDPARRARIVAARWSAGRHVIPGGTFLLAGGSGGLLLRRVLAALGADGPAARSALDAAACDLAVLPAGLLVTGDGRSGDDVVIRLRDGATPVAVWAAATRHTAGLTRRLLDDLEPVVGAHRDALAAGGWIGMRSVRQAKSRVIDRLAFCAEPEPGAAGAARLAEFSLQPESVPLADFLPHARENDAAAGRPDDKELTPS